jgi:hypothetical protein
MKPVTPEHYDEWMVGEIAEAYAKLKPLLNTLDEIDRNLAHAWRDRKTPPLVISALERLNTAWAEISSARHEMRHAWTTLKEQPDPEWVKESHHE